VILPLWYSSPPFCQESDSRGEAGRQRLQTVELPALERQLLDAELALLTALHQRITESDALVRQLSVADERVCRARPRRPRLWVEGVLRPADQAGEHVAPRPYSRYGRGR
jgi:hypothetical protein